MFSMILQSYGPAVITVMFLSIVVSHSFTVHFTVGFNTRLETYFMSEEKYSKMTIKACLYLIAICQFLYPSYDHGGTDHSVPPIYWTPYLVKLACVTNSECVSKRLLLVRIGDKDTFLHSSAHKRKDAYTKGPRHLAP